MEDKKKEIIKEENIVENTELDINKEEENKGISYEIKIRVGEF